MSNTDAMLDSCINTLHEVRKHRFLVERNTASANTHLREILDNALTPEQSEQVESEGHGYEMRISKFCSACEELERDIYLIDDSRAHGSTDAAKALTSIGVTIAMAVGRLDGSPRPWTAHSALVELVELVTDLNDDFSENGPRYRDRMLPDMDELIMNRKQKTRADLV